jgi:hypothetical protein
VEWEAFWALFAAAPTTLAGVVALLQYLAEDHQGGDRSLDSFEPRHGKTASIAVHDGAVTGEPVPRPLYDQLAEFININRQTILDYWDYKISATTMEERLQPIRPKR